MQLDQQPDVAYKRASNRGLRILDNGDLDPEGLLHIYHMEPGSVPEIEELVQEIKPEILVVDQFLNLDGAGDGNTKQMEANAKAIRNLLAKYDLVGVSVTQAGDRTERHNQEVPAWLGMGDVYASRTALAGQADLMLGLGFDEEMKAQGLRAVSIAKNKMAETHEGFTVEADFSRSRMR